MNSSPELEVVNWVESAQRPLRSLECRLVAAPSLVGESPGTACSPVDRHRVRWSVQEVLGARVLSAMKSREMWMS